MCCLDYFLIICLFYLFRFQETAESARGPLVDTVLVIETKKKLIFCSRDSNIEEPFFLFDIAAVSVSECPPRRKETVYQSDNENPFPLKSF
jgi:hypothetical protein